MGSHTVTTTRPFDICQETKAIYDYGKLYKSREHFQSFRPKSISEATDFMQYAYKQNTCLRFRGSGHTFNGVTMPETAEILVYTDQIKHFRFEADGTLTAGAGAMVWDVRDLARDYGHDLKVFNGGWAGPSVGGYISAGGFGKGNLSKTNGGLWESINYIRFIDAAGTLQTIQKTDPIFPWLFGSYGQLGLIVEANFQLVKKTPIQLFLQNISFKNLDLPLNLAGEILKRQVDDPLDNLKSAADLDPNILFWFSLLVDPQQEKQAWQDLSQWLEQYPNTLKAEGGWHGPLKDGVPIGYHYVIKYKKFHPPLIYPEAKDFLVIGVMSKLEVTKTGAISDILKVENSFIELAEKGGYKLYLQAENFGKRVDFERYYGSTIYQQFLKIKERFDPQHRINRGVFFKGAESRDRFTAR